MTPLFIKPLCISSLLLLCATPGMAQTCKAYIPDNNPDSRYTNHNDGTVTDNDTGLMWKQCVEGLSGINTCTTGSVAFYTWQAALQLADMASFATYNDWRLPNLTELDSLVTQNCYAPSINSHLFSNAPASGDVWSSSPSAYNSDSAWYVAFYSGYASNVNRGNNTSVRLVRSGQ